MYMITAQPARQLVRLKAMVVFMSTCGIYVNHYMMTTWVERSMLKNILLGANLAFASKCFWLHYRTGQMERIQVIANETELELILDIEP